MILGIDHVSLDCTDITQEKEKLIEQGFSCAFMNYDVPNHPCKKGFLHHYEPTHDIAVFVPGTENIAIEAIRHSSPAKASSKGAYTYETDHIGLRVQNCEETRQFLEKGLRFKLDQKSGFLKFTSPVPRWSCALDLQEDPNADHSQTMLDSQGFACLAFVSNAIEQDSEALLQLGAFDFSGLFEAEVNEKPLTVCLMRMPGGALIELIQFMS